MADLCEAQPMASVVYKDYCYATLCSAPLYGDELNFRQVPPSWTLAPNEEDIIRHVVARHRWDDSWLVVADGTAFGTGSNEEYSGLPFGSRPSYLIRDAQGGCAVEDQGLGVLMRRRLVVPPPGERCLPAAMWRDMHFCDCEVHCGGEVIPCHRVALASGSLVLQKMLMTDMVEGLQKKVVLLDVEPKVAKAFLQFLYINEFPMEMDIVVPLLGLADFYQVDGLAELCAEAALELATADSLVSFARSLKPFREKKGLRKAWGALLDKVKSEPALLAEVMLAL
jgi:hypothetical protein